MVAFVIFRLLERSDGSVCALCNTVGIVRGIALCVCLLEFIFTSYDPYQSESKTSLICL